LVTVLNIDEKIAEANTRLKSASNRASIERRGNKLYLRATLPAKPHLEQQAPYRQKISLNLKATHAGLQTAVIKAKLLGTQLDADNFSWNQWIEVEDKSLKPIDDWLSEFEENHWRNTKETGATVTTWTKDYQSTFNKLDKKRTLTLDYLVEVAGETEPNSRVRKKVCTYLRILGKFADIEGIEILRQMQGSYSAKSVSPRKLPKDKLIDEARNSIKSESWQWLFGMVAVYGLRSHEVFRLDLEDFPVVNVLSETKTGERFVYPLYPEWAETWKLQDMKLPDLDLNYSNAKLGTKVADWFRDRNFGFKAYDLRHSYARRCFEFGLAPDWAAGLMGHSLQVHMKTYRAWIDKAVYTKAYELVINRAGRPAPP
jgi:integrase